MNITLIGMAGVGKSKVGSALAKKLNYNFIDVGEIIENNSGLKLQQIIDKFGDEEFMKIEEKAILGLGKLNNCVISPGGSAAYSDRAMDFLKRMSAVVFMNAPFKTVDRVPNRFIRGIVGLKGKGLKKLFEERLPLYRKYADVILDLGEDYEIDGVAEEIVERLKKE
ncbi:(d)CMP kinase [Candidatus Woesearchaeota archaeon]|nr:(d)CMP kinase [Candidatus Woesearchaeota archaeon]